MPTTTAPSPVRSDAASAPAPDLRVLWGQLKHSRGHSTQEMGSVVEAVRRAPARAKHERACDPRDATERATVSSTAGHRPVVVSHGQAGLPIVDGWLAVERAELR
jgi:hypothetical protein